MENNTQGFGSKIGLLAATIGSAVGLGTIWRFPAVVQSQGGSAFLLVYFFCLLLFGIPVMLGEFSLGRAGGPNVLGIFRTLSPKTRWWLVGLCGLLASYLILPFYMVVAGWGLEYLWLSLSGSLFEGIDFAATSSENSRVFSDRMNDIMASPVEPVLWTYGMVLLNLLILLKGVQQGIEKMSKVLMPVLFLLLVVFCVVSLSLPGAMQGVEFFLKPDFSKVTPQMVVYALGQALFSLSLGMGVLLTYAAYFPKDTKLTQTSVTVSMSTLLIAVLMGLIIFPAAASFGLIDNPQELSGVTLVFVTLPGVFTQMGCPQLWAVLFFFLLFVATITSTVSIAEVTIAFLCDHFRLGRVASCCLVLLPLFITSAICSLSLGAVPWLQIAGRSVFDFLDSLTTNWLLPLSALGVCLYIGWFLKKDFIHGQLSNQGALPAREWRAVRFLLRYVCPLVLLALFATTLLWK